MILKFLKAIDLYGKIPKGLAEPTSTGAAVSVVTLVCLALLIMSEFIEWVTVDVSSDIFVDDAHSQDKVDVNLNILFPRLPCEFLDVDAFDAMGSMVQDDSRFLNFFRTNPDRKITEGYTPGPFNIDNARAQISMESGCQVSGTVKVRKVAGKIGFGPHRNHHMVQSVQQGLVLDVSHVFEHLAFGNDKDLSQVKSQFTQGQLETLNQRGSIKDAALRHVPVQHEHFISIVPTTFTLLNKQSFEVYQYTANHNEIRAQYYPQMIVRYDFSPVTFKYWQTKEDFLHFLVQICAIIGGFFTVSSMVESVVYRLNTMFTGGQ